MGLMDNVNMLVGAGIAVVVIVCATVALALGKIDGATYVGLVAAIGGVNVGVGAHASGVKQGQP